MEATKVTDSWDIVDSAVNLIWSHLVNTVLYMAALQLVNFNSIISELKNKVNTCTCIINIIINYYCYLYN